MRTTLSSLSPGTAAVRPAGGRADLALRLVPATTVYELYGKPAVPSYLRPGERLEVKDRVEPDGSLKAGKIKILAAPAVSFEVAGTLVTAGATSVRIRVGHGRTIAVVLGAGAKVTENGWTTRGASLATGDRVQVAGRASGGTYVAQRIRAQPIARKR